VTRAHLELFARDGLVDCRFNDGTVKRLAPSAIAVRKDFYVIKDGAGGRDTSLERAMAVTEAKAAAVLRRIQNWPLCDSDRTAVTEYLALLALRSPAFRTWHEARTQALLNEDWNDRRADVPEEQWDAAVGYLSGPRYWHESMMRLLSRIGSLLGSMHWTLLHFSSRSRPVAWCRSESDGT
jgi:hypothetical protein